MLLRKDEKEAMFITRECDYAVRVVRSLAGQEKLSVGDWVEITAKVRCEYTDAYQEKGPVLYIRNLKKCEACKPEVATF